MQISSNHNLPVITGMRPEPMLRQPASRQRPAIPEYQAQQASNTVSDQETRRPPVFLQPMMDVKRSRTGEEAMRTYRDVAMAGNDAELVNRVNVLV